MAEQHLAIIGAGVSGLAAAYALRDSDWAITVFEKSRGVSGRAASRSRHEARIDHGANYFKTDSAELEQLILHELPTDGLIDIAGDICLFNSAGEIRAGDPLLNSEPKWNYRDGISTLGKRLAEAASTKVRRETLISRIDEIGGGVWELSDEQHNSLGEFDAVLCTPPAPQLADVLAGSSLDGEELVELLRESEYHRQFSIILGFDRVIGRPLDCYALLNEDRQHDIAWLSFEDAKPGRVPAGGGVVIAQMAPAWTAEYYDASGEVLRDSAMRAVESVLDTNGQRPAWFDHQRWRYAHPKVALDVEEIEEAAPEGLFFAGDAFVGKGRVGAALETGLAAAERMLSALD